MLSKLLNRKYVRLLVQTIIIFVVITILINLLHSVMHPCEEKRFLSQDFNQENSIPARIKIDNRRGGLVRFVASFDPDDLLRIWNNRQTTPATFRIGDIPLVNIENHNPRLCSNLTQPLEWIIFVLSNPSNLEQRNLLRETWADFRLFKQPLTKVVFVMGQSFDVTTQDRIDEEFARYGDLVVGDFEDVPQRETLKTVLGLKWVSENCMNAKFAFKANDVSFVNIFGMMDLSKERMTLERIIMCPLWVDNSMRILRENCGNWCVPKEEFAGREFFPQYCAGLGYMTSLDVVRDLYIASLNTPSFLIEDVYVTGILPLKVSNPPDFITCLSSFSANLELLSSQYLNNSNTIDIFISQVHDTTLFRKLWTALINRLRPNWFSQLSDGAIARYA